MTDNTVLITGAAGTLGRATVAALRARGDRVVLVDRELSLLHEAFPDCSSDARCLALAADVTDIASMQHAASVAIRDFAHINSLVHIAGGFAMGEGVHELSRRQWDSMMNLNAWSFVACAHAVVPHMRAAGHGRIVAISARAAASGQAHMSAYIASKSALQRLVESLSAEVREHGIAVNSIAPSIIDTPANRQAMPDADPARWVAPETLAAAVLYLTSDSADAIHGQHLVVSGLS